MMPALFACTLFVSAALMFAVQPILARMLLPRFGGTPAVWNTCMVFFQALLLAGYSYVHLLGTRVAFRKQLFVHLALLLLALLLAPLVLWPLGSGRSWTPAGNNHPIPLLLGLLAVSVSVPFFALSTTAPLLQNWFARTRQPGADDPYFLYSASNLGSMLALLGYPLLLEPTLSLWGQGTAWAACFAVFVVLTTVCAIAARRHEALPTPETAPEAIDAAPFDPRLRFRWLALAFVPSSLLYGVTTYLSTDIASVPLLWVLPLALYLLTFILVFARKVWLTHDTILWLFPMIVLIQPFVFTLHGPIVVVFLLHLFSFFLIAMACHGELARLRPPPGQLTDFYLWLAAGGVLGGLFNTIVAPLSFTSLIEYPLAIVLACFLMPMSSPESSDERREPARTGSRLSSLDSGLNWNDMWIPLVLFLVVGAAGVELRVLLRDEEPELRLLVLVSLLFGFPAAIVYQFHQRPVRFGLCVAVLLLATNLDGAGDADLAVESVHEERSFFGIVRVVDTARRDEPALAFRRFIHGSTLHGLQRKSDDPEVRRTPLSYYFRSGPIGDVFAARAGNIHEVGVLGLGAGGLAAYAEKGQHWTFYEIDPAVLTVAETHFHFLADARQRGASIDLVVGDARLALQNGPAAAPIFRSNDIFLWGPRQRFDLLFADAFSSDAVPVHLLTREAIELYNLHLNPGGWLLVNISNRYLDLEPVVAELAAEAGLVARIREEFDAPPESTGAPGASATGGRPTITPEDKNAGKSPSRWIVLAENEADLGALAQNSKWRPLKRRSPAYLWTDDYSNLIRVLKW